VGNVDLFRCVKVCLMYKSGLVCLVGGYVVCISVKEMCMMKEFYV
jgi:hypothetical protein